MNKRKVNERDGTCSVRTQTWCQNTDLDGVEATVLPGKLQQRHQCLQQEGGSTCLQNETSLGDKHATLTVEDKDKCKCATPQQSWAAGFHVACLPKVWVLLTVGKHSECLDKDHPCGLPVMTSLEFGYENWKILASSPASQSKFSSFTRARTPTVWCFVCSWCYYKPSTQFCVALLRSIYASCMHAWLLDFTPLPHVILLSSPFDP